MIIINKIKFIKKNSWNTYFHITICSNIYIEEQYWVYNCYLKRFAMIGYVKNIKISEQKYLNKKKIERIGC